MRRAAAVCVGGGSAWTFATLGVSAKTPVMRLPDGEIARILSARCDRSSRDYIGFYRATLIELRLMEMESKVRYVVVLVHTIVVSVVAFAIDGAPRACVSLPLCGNLAGNTLVTHAVPSQ